jgi:hypothetical protein
MYSFDMKMLWGLIFIFVLTEEVNSKFADSPDRNLKIESGMFIVKKNPTFLLGITYFDALSAPDHIIENDIVFLKLRRFNSIRVFATWHEEFQPRATSVIRNNGTLNPDGVTRLKHVLNVARTHGFVVDIVFSRQALDGIGFENYKKGITTLASILQPYRAVLFDVQNETNHCGAAGDPKCSGHLSLAHVAAIRRAIKEVDPNRLITASRNGEPIVQGKDDYLSFRQRGTVDFIATHRPSRTRDGLWAHYTDNEAAEIRSILGPAIPILFDEPNRCGKNVNCSVQSATNLFITAAKNAKRSGAAGWFFHTQAGFRLTSRSLSSQLNPVERAAVDRLGTAVGM